MLPSSAKIENRLRFDEVTKSLKVGTFLRHNVYIQRKHNDKNQGHNIRAQFIQIRHLICLDCILQCHYYVYAMRIKLYNRNSQIVLSK